MPYLLMCLPVINREAVGRRMDSCHGARLRDCATAVFVRPLPSRHTHTHTHAHTHAHTHTREYNIYANTRKHMHTCTHACSVRWKRKAARQARRDGAEGSGSRASKHPLTSPQTRMPLAKRLGWMLQSVLNRRPSCHHFLVPG